LWKPIESTKPKQMIRLNNTHIRESDIKYFEISKLTSVDIRVYVYGYDGFLFWERINEEELEKLMNIK